MGARVRGISGHRAVRLGSGWELASCPPDGIARPEELAAARLDWLPASVPSTSAAVLRAASQWNLDHPARRFDAADWWWRERFAADPAEPGEQSWLCFDGLATVADVWLNGTHLLSSSSMFASHECRVDPHLRPENELVIRFHALDQRLAARRPRPRWRAPMVEHQQLRWFRTTLLGRTPGWSPPAAPVGPWREVRLERRRGLTVHDLRLRANAAGELDLGCRLGSTDDAVVPGGALILSRHGREFRAPLTPAGRAGDWAARLVVPDAERWWPHTHGEPALYSARLECGAATADLGQVGFRDVVLQSANDDFALEVNGTPIFCRGACWTPLDPVSFQDEPAAIARAFGQLVDAGMNMVRVGGTMTYETDAFLDACDAHGVLLWQDFMFANLDYPEDDPDFLNAVRLEASQQLSRLQGRPSLALLCGNSEGEQQAAMWGATKDRWTPPLFHQHLPALCREMLTDVPYWPSSAHGGSFPHQGSAGSTSYYGVGAYLRPLEDARRAEVRFASECLAFANVPEPAALAALPGGAGVRVHHAAWKARSPRDLGAGWDFDDVRDHYLQRLFGIDPVALRYADHERYLELGRVVTGEVMAQAFGEWRRARSPTRGALVWFLRDLWPGAGWGVVDATGAPKAAWHYLRRALAPVALHCSDEGGNGLVLHAVNDTAAPLAATLECTLWRGGEVQVGRGATGITIPPRGALELNAAELFDGFHDLSYAYRFGPPPYDVAALALRDSQDTILARAHHFVGGWPSARELDVGLTATASPGPDGGTRLTVGTRRFAQSVRIEIPHFASDDDYFHLAPGETRTLGLTPESESGERPTPPAGRVRALNAEVAAKVSVA